MGIPSTAVLITRADKRAAFTQEEGLVLLCLVYKSTVQYKQM